MPNSDQSKQDIAQEDPQLAKLRLEVENLRQQNEKLSFEISDLKHEGAWTKRIKNLLPVITGALAVIGFWFGIFQYFRADAAARAQHEEEEKARVAQQLESDEIFRRNLKRETAKPLWDKQLNLYIEASENAAKLATMSDEQVCEEAETRFWILYWGPLAAVEDVGLEKGSKAEIEDKMVEFGRLLNVEAEKRDKQRMKRASLALAHAIRDAIAPAFDVQASPLADAREKAL